MNTYYVNHAILSVGEKVVVYSGHFMVSSLDNPYFTSPNSNVSPSMQNPTLHSLIDFLRTIYHGVLISSKWRNFTGCSIPCSHKIRLNNAIWREWCRQHRHGKHPLVCRFNDTLNDLKLAKNNIIFERNFHNMQPIMFRGEYNKIRRFFFQRAQTIIKQRHTQPKFIEPRKEDYCDDSLFLNTYDADYYSLFLQPQKCHENFTSSRSLEYESYNYFRSTNFPPYECEVSKSSWNNRAFPKVPRVYDNQQIDFSLNRFIPQIYSKYELNHSKSHRVHPEDEFSLNAQIRQQKRHLTHLRSEKHRRSEIKNWIDQLHDIIQDGRSSSSGRKPSYAHILHEASELLKQNQAEYNNDMNAVKNLKLELERTNKKNRALREIIPTKDSNIDVVNDEYGKYLDFLLKWGMVSPKFIICGLIMGNAFKSLVGFNISQKSRNKDIHCWINDNVFLQRFREDSSAVLQMISTKTSIIEDPSKLGCELRQMLKDMIAENMQ